MKTNIVPKSGNEITYIFSNRYIVFQICTILLPCERVHHLQIMQFEETLAAGSILDMIDQMRNLIISLSMAVRTLSPLEMSVVSPTK